MITFPFCLPNRIIIVCCASCCWHRHLKNFTRQFQNTHQTPSPSSHSVPDRPLPVLKPVTNPSYRSHNTSAKQQSFHPRHQNSFNDNEGDYYESYIQ